jgi:hypothetical protein
MSPQRGVKGEQTFDLVQGQKAESLQHLKAHSAGGHDLIDSSLSRLRMKAGDLSLGTCIIRVIGV